jgi:resuscitation-promoting factor RpfA
MMSRVAAPAAFLVAMTVLVLLVRSSLDAGEPAATAEPGPTETAPAEPQQPPPETEAAPPPEPETEPEPPQQPPAQTPPAEEAGATYYEIRSGDTLEAIANEHGTTVQRLLELNPGIDPVALTVGQRIRIA